MGCFSFICKECGKAILSNSFAGEDCKLFLLKEGKVIQTMEGEYDSYGRTFIDGTQVDKVNHKLRKSSEWEDPGKDFSENDWKLSGGRGRDPWHRVCDLMLHDNQENGIAAIHSKCFKEVPKTRSEDDPNQGWGDDGEYLEDTDPEANFEE